MRAGRQADEGIQQAELQNYRILNAFGEQRHAARTVCRSILPVAVLNRCITFSVGLTPSARSAFASSLRAQARPGQPRAHSHRDPRGGGEGRRTQERAGRPGRHRTTQTRRAAAASATPPRAEARPAPPSTRRRSTPRAAGPPRAAPRARSRAAAPPCPPPSPRSPGQARGAPRRRPAPPQRCSATPPPPAPAPQSHAATTPPRPLRGPAPSREAVRGGGALVQARPPRAAHAHS